MNCSRCNKRLSRKSARQIGGKIICSACLFPKLKGGRPVPAPQGDSGSGPQGGDGTAPGEAPQSGRSDSEGIAQPTPSENINGK